MAMRRKVLVPIAIAIAGASIALHAVEVPMVAAPPRPVAKAASPPMRLAETREVLPMHSLPEAAKGASDELVALNNWNLGGNLPVRNGFARALPTQLKARLTPSATQGSLMTKQGGGWLATDLRGRAVWGTSVTVDRSYRLRLELRDVRLPEGSHFWVWGETEAPIEFDLSLLAPDRTLWTPSVGGPTIYFEVVVPVSRTAAKENRFSMNRILQLFELDEDRLARLGLVPAAKQITACLIDAACVTDANVSGVSLFKEAIARLEYIDAGISKLCSGGLLNDTQNDFIPYLLTANHCISQQSVAGTLEAFWDYIDSSCLGSAPSLNSVPRSSGGTLLSASASSDYSLIRLASAPGSRVFLGWTSAPAATTSGTPLIRLSHPLGIPMGFSKSNSWNPPQVCTGLPVSSFLYSDPQPELGNGAVFGGSSGSPVLLGNGQVVGQLLGACGPNSSEPCLAGVSDSNVDGRFSSTYPALAQWLSPSGGSGPCTTDATTACLQGGRFEVKVDWQNESGSGAGQVMAFGGQRAENHDSAFYWFFSDTNFEMGLKILDACSFNNKFWVFISGLTNVGWTVHIRDVNTGATKTYSNANGHLTSTTADTAAISCQ